MRAGKVMSFRKQATCPASDTLLSYRDGKLKKNSEVTIEAHLASCDFCCAELQLLTECPVAYEVFTPPTSCPTSLRRLAEEILKGSFLNRETFGDSPFEKERLTLTDA